MSPLAQSIQAILFATSEPQSVSSLSTRLNSSKEDIKKAMTEVSEAFSGHGIFLVMNDDSATLATRPEQSSLIEAIRKEELQKELSKATAETLAVIAYHPNATKAQVEFIRGVNASYSLRALQIRGLIEQKGAGRSVTYHPTLEALRHFGVERMEELPDFAETSAKISALLDRDKEETE